MSKITKSVLVGAAMMMVGSAASAATVYAQSVVTNTGETCSTPASVSDRTNLCNSLAAPDVTVPFQTNGFTSSGNWEELTYTFGGTYNVQSMTLWEISYKRPATYVENLEFTLLNSVTNNTTTGVVTNVDGTPDGADRWMIVVNETGMFDKLIVSDNSVTTDGFDIDAIAWEVAEVPLPASALLLVAGLGAFGMVRRKA